MYIYIYNTYTYIYIYNIMENIQRTSALQYIFLFLLFKTFDSCIYVTEVKVFTGFKLQSLLHWTLERVRGQVLSASWFPHRSQRRRSNGDLRVESRTDFTKVTKRKNRGRNYVLSTFALADTFIDENAASKLVTRSLRNYRLYLFQASVE